MERTLARLLALAESYGCSDLEALRSDLTVVLRVEYLTWQRQVKSVDERWRRRVERGANQPTRSKP